MLGLGAFSFWLLSCRSFTLAEAPQPPRDIRGMRASVLALLALPPAGSSAAAAAATATLAADAPPVTLASGWVLPDSSGADAARLSNTTSSPFMVYFSFSYNDNVVAATHATAAEATAKGYKAYPADNGACANATGTFGGYSDDDFLPLQTYWSAKLNDTLTTASTAGLAWASNASNEYTLLRTECTCARSPPTGEPYSTWVTYWSDARRDSFLVKVS
jgi:hypothetical protein